MLVREKNEFSIGPAEFELWASTLKAGCCQALFCSDAQLRAEGVTPQGCMFLIAQGPGGGAGKKSSGQGQSGDPG